MLRLPIDTKAMRKIDSEEVLFASIEVVEVGGSGLSVYLASRSLDKLP